MSETISVRRLFQVVKKRLWLLLASGIIGGLVAGGITYFVLTAQYSAQAQLIVTLAASETMSVNDIDTNLQLINTYKDMVTGDLVMGEVSRYLEAEESLVISKNEVREAIEVQQSQNSQMFSIVATSDQPEKAALLANTTVEIFKKNIKKILNLDRVSIASYATANPVPVFPVPQKMILIGGVLGLVVGMITIFSLEVLGPRIKNQAYLTDNYEVPILGRIPLTKSRSSVVKKTMVAEIRDSSVKDRGQSEKDYGKKIMRGAK